VAVPDEFEHNPNSFTDEFGLSSGYSNSSTDEFEHNPNLCSGRVRAQLEPVLDGYEHPTASSKEAVRGLSTRKRTRASVTPKSRSVD
jgi:hypothetical protein